MAEIPPSSLTIVIPTYNREKVLARALQGYLGQTSPDLVHELIVVDDGSTDGTESRVREFSQRSPFPVRYLRQQNKGPAAARNFGIREAQSPLLLFTDSDIIPDRDLVRQHIEWHRESPQLTAAVLGYTTWAPEVRPTPFMRWYGEYQIFGFAKLKNKQEASFDFFYTCNVSLKTEFLRSSGQFDEDFKSAAYEDTELAFRLSRAGMRLLYNPAAVGYHYQFFSFADACRKVSGNSAATQLFFRKEAGQHVQKELQAKRSSPGYRIAQTTASVAANLLHPLTHLVDSPIPLARVVYSLLFWNATKESLKQRN